MELGTFINTDCKILLNHQGFPQFLMVDLSLWLENREKQTKMTFMKAGISLPIIIFPIVYCALRQFDRLIP